MIKLFKRAMQKVFGYCGMCEARTGKGRWFRYPYTARQNTAYEDDSKNFFFGCKECHRENDAHWEDMWLNVPGYI